MSDTRVPDVIVRLRELDEESLADLLAVAVAEADPLEVMPPVDGPSGWTERRRAAFLRFHRERSIGTATPVETTYVVEADGRVVGAARLEPSGDAVEAGVWLGRSWRGSGIGRLVGAELVTLARAAGARRFTAVTETSNPAARGLLAGIGAEATVRDGEVAAELVL